MTTETLALIAVVLLAVLVGAAFPALLQLRQTLRSAQIVLDRTGPKIDRIAADAAQAVERINRVSATVEDVVGSVQGAMSAVGDLGRAVGRLRDHLETAVALGAALGPAISAGARALFAPDVEPGRDGEARPAAEDDGPSTLPDIRPGDDKSPEEETP